MKGRDKVLFLLLGAGLALRLAVAWHPLESLIPKVIPDEAFYYFQNARNLARGLGLTFDGQEPTNGFHPLWFLLITPMYLLFPKSLDLPVHLGLSLSSLMDVMTGFFIYKTVSIFSRVPMPGLVAAGLYLLNPFTILQANNCLETGLTNLLLAWSFYYFFCLSQREGVQSNFDRVKLGILLGLLMLARTDTFIVVGVVLLFMLSKRASMGYRGIFLVALTAFIVVLPWLLWNLMTFGTIVQASGGAYSYVSRQNLYSRGFSFPYILMLHLKSTLGGISDGIFRHALAESGLLSLGVGFLACFFFLRPGTTRQSLKGLPFLTLPVTALGLFIIVHSLLRGVIKLWYFAPFSYLGALLAGTILQGIEDKPLWDTWQKRALALAVLALGISGYLSYGLRAWSKGYYSQEKEQLMAAQWIREKTQSEHIIGSFNAGILGYFSDRTVVNLDGLANNEALRKIKQRKLWSYIRQREIDFLVDSPYSLLQDYRLFYGEGFDDGMHLKFIAEIDDPRVSWANANVHIYRVIK